MVEPTSWRPIIPQPGSAKDPATFVGRVATTSRARRKLLAGTDLLLSDPRRMGKTYWMQYFAATTTDFTAILIDYEGVGTAEDFLLRTLEALRPVGGVASRIRGGLAQLVDNFGAEPSLGPVKLKITMASQPAIDLLTQVVSHLDQRLADAERPVLLCMDEVPIAIQNITRHEGAAIARTLLGQLRQLRQSTRHIRWIVAGSIGFHHVLREAGMTIGALNDLDNLPLGPLERADATELAVRLFLGIGRTADHQGVARLVERSGGIPHLIHKLASLIQFPPPGMPDPAQVTAQVVDQVFDAWIDDRDFSQDATHFLTRIEDYYGAEASVAHAVLRAALAGPVRRDDLPPAVRQSKRWEQVVEDLIADHYLVATGADLAWRYPVIREIYARRKGIEVPR